MRMKTKQDIDLPNDRLWLDTQKTRHSLDPINENAMHYLYVRQCLADRS